MLVVLLVFVVVGFIRGLETSLTVSGDPRVVLVHTLGTAENLESSSVPGRTADLLAASLPAVHKRYGASYSSPELYFGTRILLDGDVKQSLGLVRGVTPSSLLVRRNVQLLEGRWPGPGEALVGRLAATKLGSEADRLAVGRTIEFEGRSWRVCGTFAAVGSALESEIWCPLDELQQATKRTDLTMEAIALGPDGSFADVDEFCKERLDLELQATPETEYYEALHRHYRPVLMLAWLVVALLAGAGIFAGLNTMYGAVVGRVRELATLQTLGFVRRAVALSLVQEGTLLAATASLIAAFIALAVLNGVAVRFTMGAFTLRIDGLAIAIGCGTGLLLGMIGSLPPAIRAMRLPLAEGLKAF
jgi:ABC-type lipoprotein release transport system permease subunit